MDEGGLIRTRPRVGLCERDEIQTGIFVRMRARVREIGVLRTSWSAASSFSWIFFSLAVCAQWVVGGEWRAMSGAQWVVVSDG
jgi:hypothetical protein